MPFKMEVYLKDCDSAQADKILEELQDLGLASTSMKYEYTLHIIFGKVRDTHDASYIMEQINEKFPKHIAGHTYQPDQYK